MACGGGGGVLSMAYRSDDGGNLSFSDKPQNPSILKLNQSVI